MVGAGVPSLWEAARMSEVLLQVKVQPGSRRNEVVGFQGEVLRLRVTAPPERGRANQAVIELLAQTLGIRKSQVSVIQGAVSREKLLAIKGLDAVEMKRALTVGGAQ